MTDFMEPKYIQTNGIRMAVYEQGSGTPVIFCHGWPELAYSWRHQIPALAAAGFRAIAPDQRGYGRTDRPENITDYDIQHLTGDLVGLCDALGIEKAVFCGHDWGGIIAWQMPLLHPDRVAGVIGLNTPFIKRAPADPIALFRKMYGEDMYIVWFQQPGVAEAVFDKDPAKVIRLLMRKSGMSVAEYDAMPVEKRRFEMKYILDRDEQLMPGAPLLSDAEVAYFAENFKRTGFRGGINWYRNFTRNWHLLEGVEERINVPCLMIMAENDVVLRPSSADGVKKVCPNLEKYLVRNCGHWTQQEHPDEVNRVIIGWMQRHFK
ncbi:MAG: alpha/beta hydrolase [Alphaproteobacteria bacterium]|nr:alpha/beta hydrolase [Alphaproteobacteria bacterium]